MVMKFNSAAELHPCFQILAVTEQKEKIQWENPTKV